MDTEQTRPQIPMFVFRVLVVGRANAGKTSILQRVCETTESPIIYRGHERVKLDPSMDRGEHEIDDELKFFNHRGYVFHDSRGIECGDTKELETLKEFIRRKCREERLRDKLHAIWYCVPMDNHRPALDLEFYDKICPDPNVPVIAVFTKYDQFLRNVKMDVSDYPDLYPGRDGNQVAETLFQDHYLRPLGDNARYVRLEKMHMKDSRCDSLVEETAAALNEDTVALMLLAVQRGNIELSVKTALSRVHSMTEFEVDNVIRECLIPFPYIWFYTWELSRFFERETTYREDFNNYINLFKSLPAIQNLILNGSSQHHLIIAIILILKQAMFPRHSIDSQSALFQAEQSYQGENIDSKILEYLKEVSPENSVKQFSGFIMATDIVPTQSFIDTSE